MKTTLIIGLIMLLCAAPVNAEEFFITKEDAPGGGVRYSVKNDSCYIDFEMQYADGGSEPAKYVDKGERCSKDVSYEYKLKIYDALLERIFNEGYFAKDNNVNIYWGSTDYSFELGCRLIKHGSISPSWKNLLKMFDNRPVEFGERNPFPEQLGIFVKESGVLAEIDAILLKHGFQLRYVKVGAFSSRLAKNLSSKQLNCLPQNTSVNIVPTSAELYLVFVKKRNSGDNI